MDLRCSKTGRKTITMSEDMDEEKIGKVSGLVPEIWHDLIARIIPGLVIIYTTYRPDHESVITLTISGFVFSIIAAYLVGLTMDLMTGGVTERFVAKSKNQVISSLSVKDYNEVDKLPSPSREIIVKMFAEVVLCRSLFFFSFFQFVYYAGFLIFEMVFVANCRDVRFEAAFCFLGTIIAAHCWFWMNEAANKRRADLLARSKKEDTDVAE